MGVVHKRVFYYHADASTLGGHFRSPLQQDVPIQTPISLSPSGGFGSAHSERYSFQDLVSFERAYTTVSGAINEDTKGFRTTVSATIEGLSILGVVTAERVVARIASESPSQEGEYEPTVTFAGSHFDGLKISGCPVEVVIDQHILHPEHPEPPDPRDAPEGKPFFDQSANLQPPARNLPLIENPLFIAKVQRQYNRMRDSRFLPGWVTDRSIPEWIPERYPANLQSKINQRGMILCTLVKSTSGEFAGAPYGNVFSIPDIGRVFLGEVLVDRNTHRLIMVRVELGCGTNGDLSGASVAVEGRGHP